MMIAVSGTEKPITAAQRYGAEKTLSTEKEKPSETLTEHFRGLAVILFQ